MRTGLNVAFKHQWEMEKLRRGNKYIKNSNILFSNLSVKQTNFSDLPNCRPMFHFYTPWKRQKASGCLAFSGGIPAFHTRETEN